MIKGVVWSCDRAGDGVRQLKCVRDEYIWNGINPIREKYSRENSFIEFENGDYWRVAAATESSRGIRANYALIDVRTSKEFVWSVILRTLTCPFGPRHYEFFYPKEW